MTINAGEYKSTVGVSSLYVAAIIKDALDGYTADTPEYLAPVAEIGAAPAVNQETQYADDAPYDVFVNEGETELTLTVTGIPPEMLAKILGKVFDATTGRLYDVGSTPPEYALGFKSQKSNGKYRYYWYMKGRFSAPEESFETKSDSPSPQTIQVTFTAVRSSYAFDVGAENATVKRVWGDEDTENFSGTTWFTQVQTPGVGSPAALALASSSPADDASDVLISANVVLNFNNTLALGAQAGCVLVKHGTQTVVAAARSISANRKTVTLNPDSNLEASTTYDVVIGVTDIYGDTLDQVINFETAA